MKKIFILFTLMCTLWRAEGQSNITQAEYFVDTDPGRGKATPVTIPTPSTNVKNVPFTVALSGLSEGFHRVYMRTYNGRWSHTSSSMIYKLGASNTLKKITGAEYFVDTDPGRGKGKSISITSDFDVKNASFTLALSSLAEGFHRFYVRTRDGNGSWSHTSSYLFYKFVVGVSDTTLVQAEYFVDNDPGHGKATGIAVTPGKKLTNVAFSLPLSALSEGFHRLFIRTKDAYKRWSLTNSTIFYKYVIPQTDTTITEVEYFVDTDPGHGKATQLNITPSKNLVNKEFTLPLNNLSTGMHRLYIRTKNAYKRWSHTNSILFYKYAPPADTALVQAEYFIDTDPGHGKGNPVALNPEAKWRDSTVQVNITGLSKGTHTFYLRTRSNSGKWSLTNMDTFHVGTVPSAPAIVVSKFTKRSLCAGERFSLSYAKTGAFQNTNVFSAQLSDKNGSFSSPTVIGTLSTNTSNIIACKLPNHIATSSRYRVRIVSTTPAITGEISKDSLYIVDRPAAPVITGDSNVNVNADNLYNVPLVNGSIWFWSADSAVVTPNKNNATINWNKAALGRMVRVVEKSKYGCLGDTGVKSVNVYAASIDSVKILDLNPCPGSTTTVTAKVSGAYASLNVFTVQLSSATGGFASPVNIGSLAANPAGVKQPISIPVRMPYPLANGTAYKVRIVSSMPVVTSSLSIGNISVSKPNVGVDKTVSKCPGAATDLTTLFVTTNLNVLWNVTRPDSVVTPGKYRIIVTNSKGCKDTAYATVVDYTNSRLGNDTTVTTCPGTTRSISNVYNLSAFTVQQWSTPNPDSVGAGVYTLMVETANGCKDTAVITVTSTCAIPTSRSKTNVTATSATVFWKHASCVSAYDMQYREKGTTAFTTVSTTDSLVNIGSLSSGTIYEWQVQTVCSTSPRDTSGYSALSEFTTSAPPLAKGRTPEIATGESDSWKATIYPNPARQKATLQVTGLNNYTVSISSAEGKVLWQTNTVNTSTLVLPVNGFASGIYIVSINHKMGTKSLQLIAEK